MGNNPREKSIYMSGFTWGAGFGLTLAGIVTIVLSDEYGPGVLGATGLIMGLTLVAVSFIWRRRANK